MSYGAPIYCRLLARGHSVTRLPQSDSPDSMSVIQQRAKCTRPDMQERRYSVGCRTGDILSPVFSEATRRTVCPSSSSAQNARAPTCRSADILSAAGRGTFCHPSSAKRLAGQHVRHPAARKMHAPRHAGAPIFCRLPDGGHFVTRLPRSDSPDSMSVIQQRAKCTRPDMQERRYSVGCWHGDILSPV
jgi:hypothetical protein